MAQIVIKTVVKKKDIKAFLSQVYKTCRTDPNLSPRTLKEFENAYAKKNLLIAVDGLTIIGWLLRIPYTQKFQELAAGFVTEPYRSKGVFGKLLQEALRYRSASSIVTFNNPFADYLLKKVGFKKSSLWEAIKLSNGKFILNRLNLQRIKAIKKHYQVNKPIYMIHKSK